MRSLARRALLAVSLMAAVTATAGPASASDFVPEGVFVPVGLTVAGATHGKGSGFVLGAEASAVYFNGAWIGGYLDAARDFGAEELRISTGPELGFGPIGADFGYVAAVDDDGGYRHGYVARGLLTISLAAVYGRYVTLFGGDAPPERFAEIGMMFKFPIPAYTPKRVEPAAVERDAAAKQEPVAKPVASDPPPDKPVAAP